MASLYTAGATELPQCYGMPTQWGVYPAGLPPQSSPAPQTNVLVLNHRQPHGSYPSYIVAPKDGMLSQSSNVVSIPSQSKILPAILCLLVLAYSIHGDALVVTNLWQAKINVNEQNRKYRSLIKRRINNILTNKHMNKCV